ncbi:MAG: Maf family protein [Candidatus Hodarchaeales archaeon]|jgi:septum formation protein
MIPIPPVILASQSSARAALLSQINLNFISIPSEIRESELLLRDIDPKTFVLQVSIKKALFAASKLLSEQQKSNIIIGCDTIVVDSYQRIIGKPENQKEAYNTLNNLSGKEHTVLSGCAVVILPDKNAYQTAVSTIVKFRELQKEEINYYLNKGEWLNHAGSYAIQGIGVSLIEYIRGDYCNIVGLPISWLWQTLIDHFGVSSFFSKLIIH